MSNPTDPAAVLYVRRLVVWLILFTYAFVSSRWVNVRGRSSAQRYTSLVGVYLKSKNSSAH